MNQEINNEVIAETAGEQTAEAAEEAQTEAVAEVAEEVQTEAVSEIEENDSKPPKKKSKAGKVIGTVAIVLVALVLVALIAAAILGVTLFNKATAPVELPVEEKVSASDMTMFVAESCIGLLSEDSIKVGNDDMQMLIDKVKATVETSLAGTPIELRDLFCVLAEDKGNIYGKVYISELEVSGINLAINKEVAFNAVFDVNYEAPYIVAQIKELKCGELAIPVSLVTQFTSGIQLPEGLKIEGDEIYYDVSGLDTMVDEMLPKVMSDSLGDGFIASALSNLLVESTNVEITGADIIDNELVIQGHIF